MLARPKSLGSVPRRAVILNPDFAADQTDMDNRANGNRTAGKPANGLATL